MADSPFETREDAWSALAAAQEAMLTLPKKDWPEDVEETILTSREYLEEHPPTPATQVTMRLHKDSIQEITKVLVPEVVRAVNALYDEDGEYDIEGLLQQAYETRMSVEPAQDSPPPVVTIDPAEVARAERNRVRLAESSEPQAPPRDDDYDHNAPPHECRANLDFDDICSVCGRDFTPVRTAGSVE